MPGKAIGRMGETVVVATAVRDECMDVNDTKNRGGESTRPAV